jgi:hypothetical protein
LGAVVLTQRSTRCRIRSENSLSTSTMSTINVLDYSYVDSPRDEGNPDRLLFKEIPSSNGTRTQ